MDGDLLELLFVAAFILFGLLGGRKKKRPASPVPRPRPELRSRPDRTAVARPGAPRGGRAPAPRAAGTEQDRLLRELESLLTGRPIPPEPPPAPARAPVRELPDPDEARSLESLEAEAPSRWEEAATRATEATEGTARWRAGRTRAVESLETLEEAGGASHERFHALYDRPPEPAEPRGTQPMFPAGDMRRAIIWSEILGPPVSER
jgi:hypothetical protein